MRAVISCFILIVLLIQEGITYATQINVSSATTSTISNFYQDFSFCSCDRTPSLCDNYCCCDSACSAVRNLKLRPQLLHGLALIVALPPLRLFSIFATNHRVQATVHLMTYFAFTSQIEVQ